jgi:hypothetical protein
MIAGLVSRRYRGELPLFLAEYAGDTLWALMLFLLVSIWLAGRSIPVRGAIALALAFMVEISQLYHASCLHEVGSGVSVYWSSTTPLCFERISPMRFAESKAAL